MDGAEKIEVLFQTYKKDVYNFLLYYMRTSDVEDVFQDTFINAFKAIQQSVHLSNERSWLISIARHSAIDHIRKEEKQLRNRRRFERHLITHEHSNIDETLQLNEREMVILDGIYKLKENYQEVTILRGLKEFSVLETAQILNWNENKVRITYHRALRKLRDILSQGGARFESF